MSSRAAPRLETLGFSLVFHYGAGKQDWFAYGLPREGQEAHATWAVDMLLRDVPTCHLGDLTGEIRARLPAGWNKCVVVGNEGVVLGLLDEQGLESGPERPVEQVMEAGPKTFRPNVLLQRVSHYMEDRGTDMALITSPDGKLMGVLRLEEVKGR